MKRIQENKIAVRRLPQRGICFAFAAFAFVGGSTSAQSAPPVGVDRDAADSASTARTQYRAAREALARLDTATALVKLRLAANAWPLQPAYSNALLELASHLNDSKTIAHALGLANRIGVALPASESALLNSRRGADSFRSMLIEQNTSRMPIVRSQPFRTLADSLLFPEGLSIDSRNGTLYVSSVRHHNVLAVAPDGREYSLLQGVHANVGGIYGIVVDTVRGLLWAGSAPTPEMSANGDSGASVSALLAIRLRDGQLVRRIGVPTSVANSSPGDIALMANGDVLLADSQAAVLWWLRGAADTLVGIRHHLFRSLQGVVPSADGRIAWIADYSHGLLRVELNTGTVTRVADMPGHTTVGIDGMVRYGDSFVAVQNGFAPTQVLQLKLDARGSRITQYTVIDRNLSATSPTGGVVVKDHFVYIANSLWDLLDAAGTFPAGAVLPRPLLLSVPLRH